MDMPIGPRSHRSRPRAADAWAPAPFKRAFIRHAMRRHAAEHYNDLQAIAEAVARADPNAPAMRVRWNAPYLIALWREGEGKRTLEVRCHKTAKETPLKKEKAPCRQMQLPMTE